MVHRSPSLGLAATAWAVAAAAALLAVGTFGAEVCFTSSGGGGGCRYAEWPVLEMLGRYPAQSLFPIAYLVVLAALAFAAWRSRVHATQRAAAIDAFVTATYGLLVAPGLSGHAPLLLFVPGFLLLVLGFAASPRDVALGTAAIVLGWPAAEFALALVSAGLPPVHGLVQMSHLFWTCAGVLGGVLAAGAGMAGRGWPLAGGALTAYATVSLGAMLALPALVAFFYPRGVYENIGGPSLFVVLGYVSIGSAIVAPFAFRLILGMSWARAMAAATLLLVGFPAGSLLAFAAASVLRVRLPFL